MAEIVVVGGGAAGMMAAVAAAECGCAVSIYEKNEKLGKKIYITGKGRCNLTNACDTEELFSHVVSNGKFLYSSFYEFSNFDLMEFMCAQGCALKVERGQRVFPVLDHASDVTRALERRLRALGVKIYLNEEISAVDAVDGAVRGVVRKRGGTRSADAVILATGGLSYPSTGSTGDGYRFARALGHAVTALSPALVPMESPDPDIPALQGLSLRNVRVRLLAGGNGAKKEKKEKLLYEELGELLFTHFGVSGPVPLSASSYVAKRMRSGGAKDTNGLVLSIDLKPGLTPEQLDQRLIRDFEEYRNRDFKNSLDKLLPSSLIPVIVDRSGIAPDKQVNEVSRAERARLAALLKDFRIPITGLRGYREAIITQGGVNVREVNPSTMESRLVRGLYFAGEVLDLDAVTGGFNLQIAWSTGHLAGRAAGENCLGTFDSETGILYPKYRVQNG